MLKKDSLKKVRRTLKICLAASHTGTDAKLTKCLNETIRDLDREIEKDKSQLDLYAALKLIGKTLDKLPWIVLLLEKLK